MTGYQYKLGVIGCIVPQGLGSPRDFFRYFAAHDMTSCIIHAVSCYIDFFDYVQSVMQTKSKIFPAPTCRFLGLEGVDKISECSAKDLA